VQRFQREIVFCTVCLCLLSTGSASLTSSVSLGSVSVAGVMSAIRIRKAEVLVSARASANASPLFS
jgi:hypothetical protein